MAYSADINTAENHQSINISGVEIKIIRKNIKNIYLRIKPPFGEAVITAPQHVSLAKLAEFAASREQWIRKSQQKIANADPKKFKKEDKFGNKKYWSDERKSAAEAKLAAIAGPIAEKYAPIVGKKPSSIKYRLMKTRWGSCTHSTGAIRLNLELANMSEDLIEYVVLHEMTHLWECNHGEGFKRRLSLYLPDWKERKKRLNSF